jgi:hypothetical protein
MVISRDRKMVRPKRSRMRRNKNCKSPRIKRNSLLKRKTLSSKKPNLPRRMKRCPAKMLSRCWKLLSVKNSALRIKLTGSVSFLSVVN